MTVWEVAITVILRLQKKIRYFVLMEIYYGCSSVVRRPSLHEKDAMSAKDARDEGRHVLEMMAATNENDDDEDEGLAADRGKVIQCMFFITVLYAYWEEIVTLFC